MEALFLQNSEETQKQLIAKYANEIKTLKNSRLRKLALINVPKNLRIPVIELYAKKLS